MIVHTHFTLSEFQLVKLYNYRSTRSTVLGTEAPLALTGKYNLLQPDLCTNPISIPNNHESNWACTHNGLVY